MALSKTPRLEDGASGDRGQRIGAAVTRRLGSKLIGRVVASEAKTIAYAILPRATVAEDGYAVHKGDGMRLLFAVFAVMSLVETIVLHLLLGLLSATLAWMAILVWIATITNLYMTLVLVGHVRALGQRPVRIASGSLHLRNGIFAEADIAMSDVVTAHASALEGARPLTPLGAFERQNCTVVLKRPAPVQMLFGIRVLSNSISFNVAEPKRLVGELEKYRELAREPASR